jgi:hypothetical protein
MDQDQDQDQLIYQELRVYGFSMLTIILADLSSMGLGKVGLAESGTMTVADG